MFADLTCVLTKCVLEDGFKDGLVKFCKMFRNISMMEVYG